MLSFLVVFISCRIIPMPHFWMTFLRVLSNDENSEIPILWKIGACLGCLFLDILNINWAMTVIKKAAKAINEERKHE